MAMAFGFLFMLGAGMIAAFLAGARVARSASQGIAVHGLPPAAHREHRIPDAQLATDSAEGPAVYESSKTSLLDEEELASAASDAPVSVEQTLSESRLQPSNDSASALRASPCGRDAAPPANDSTVDLSATRTDVTLSRRAAEAALEAAAHRYGFDERDEAAVNNPFINARKHARANFRGTALATIYPHESRRNKEPVQCMVLTRDLSCSGIGIAHSEQLYPKQIIVLEAVGKLLVGEVRWCRRVDDNFYVAGCRLVKTTG